jgi:hypothetical protein
MLTLLPAATVDARARALSLFCWLLLWLLLLPKLTLIFMPPTLSAAVASRLSMALPLIVVPWLATIQVITDV